MACSEKLNDPIAALHVLDIRGYRCWSRNEVTHRIAEIERQVRSIGGAACAFAGGKLEEMIYNSTLEIGIHVG